MLLLHSTLLGSPPALAPCQGRLCSEGGVTLVRAVKHFTSSPTFELGSSHFCAASGHWSHCLVNLCVTSYIYRIVANTYFLFVIDRLNDALCMID